MCMCQVSCVPVFGCHSALITSVCVCLCVRVGMTDKLNTVKSQYSSHDNISQQRWLYDTRYITVYIACVCVYLYEAELSPVDGVGHWRQRGDGQQREQPEGHDAYRDVQLHPPHVLVNPHVLRPLLKLDNTWEAAVSLRSTDCHFPGLHSGTFATLCLADVQKHRWKHNKNTLI